jgi:hypothetical protein
MSRCTAPVKGHHTSSGLEACPVHGGSGRYRGPSKYTPYSPPPYYSSGSGGGGRSSGGGGSSSSARPRWSPPGSSVLYTPAEVRTLEPFRETVEKRASLPDLRQIFLCHAWDDRHGVAKELYDLLVAHDVSVWFSEKDIGLGEPFLRAIDNGLAKSRIGIVLVTPALLKRLPAAGVADKELSVLLARNLLVPTTEEPMADVAAKLAELVVV